jgi:DNA-binding MarR family transcriptional regulator
VSNDSDGATGATTDATTGPETAAHTLTNELFELSMAVDLVGNAAATRIGINQTDLICLNLLVRHGPMSPGQVAGHLGLTTAAISAMATRLERGGYAYREIDPADRRRIVMHASPSGADCAFGLFDGFYQAAVDLFGRYGEQERALLLDLLGRFRQVLVDQAGTIKSS